LPGLLASAVLGLGVGACGGGAQPRLWSNAPTASTATTAPNFSTHNNDRDNDGDHNEDDGKVLNDGHAAGALDRQSSIMLVTHYFAAAAAADGATGCSLLVPFVAESVPETVENTPCSER
jgi:hypothetical protein